MRMTKYVLKRLLLMIFTFFVIITIAFTLVRMLPRELPMEANLREVMLARFEALGSVSYTHLTLPTMAVV